LRSARRLLRRKERQAAGEFLAEGRQAVREALLRPGTAHRLFVAADAVERHADLLDAAAAAGVPSARVPARELAGLSDTVTPQGVVAVCGTVDVPATEVWAARPRLVVVCDQVRDPGNLGTVIRCADAFGADAVLISGDAVDVYNPKTVRASTGSVFHLPLVVDVDLAVAAADARAAGLQVLGADGAAASDVDELRRSGALARPTAWVMGNEAWGLPPERAALLDAIVALPLYGRAESLNLSTAAAVLLYASATAQREADR
jgi:TrmH family RNA methyltransferase